MVRKESKVSGHTALGLNVCSSAPQVCDLECLGKKSQLSSYSNVPDCRARAEFLLKESTVVTGNGGGRNKSSGKQKQLECIQHSTERGEQLEKDYWNLRRRSLESAPEEYTAYTQVKMHTARQGKTGSCRLNNFQLSHSVGRSSISDQLTWKDLTEDLVHVAQIPETSHLSIELK